MGGENLHEIQFNDCELPLENLVINEDGFRKLLTAFNTQRCLNPSISLGLAEGAFDEAVNYVRERTVFGKPIADHQGIRWKLADMFKDIEAGRGLLYRACLTAESVPRSVHGGGGKGVQQRDVAARHVARRCSCTVASASPTNTRCRGCIAARATARSAAAPRRRCAT